jgi:hypothetical protein
VQIASREEISDDAEPEEIAVYLARLGLVHGNGSPRPQQWQWQPLNNGV